MAEKFKIGQWWKTRYGHKVLIWDTDPHSAFGVDRPILGAFYKGSIARWPMNGLWSGEPLTVHDNDLMCTCDPPEEFGGPPKDDYRILTEAYVKEMLAHPLPVFITHFCAAGMYDVYRQIGHMDALIDMQNLLKARFAQERLRALR